VTSAGNEPVSFEEQIKPLFREFDRNSMLAVFDLWSVEDVRQRSDAILSQVTAGTMPCDGAWTEDKVDLFRRWVASGKVG
jgi:hypothetical protein